MLKSLQVSNYAIIDNLEISFSKGFNIITGETGAGKSILIGALGLIMGKRADTKVLFDLSKKCIVEANFDIGAYALESFLTENDLEYDEDLLLRREILPNSKSRAFVNDSPVNLKLMKDLCSKLIDMHQQFDTLGLNNPEVQLNLLDAYAGNQELVIKYSDLFLEFQQLKQLLSRLIKKRSQAQQEQELLKYHLQEFEDLGLEEGLLITWENELSLLENAESIKSALSKSAYAINEADPSVISGLEELNYEISKISSFHPKITELAEQYNNIIEELKDLGSAFQQQAEITDLDPIRLEEIQAKINLAYQLQSKHNVNTESDMLAKWEEISTKISGFKKSSNEIKNTEAKIAKLHNGLKELALKISDKRKKVSSPLCKSVELNLHQLSMENARFQISIIDLEELSETGMNDVNFRFSANKGARLQEISEVASGGELSRLSLCIKSQLAQRIKLPTLIFDEIDSGVSGAISMKMGNMIKMLAASHQIINITHSPQIASKAEKHYRIFKESNADRSYTKMEVLIGEEKTLEIAKMLSGDPPSAAAIENAKELMALA